MPPGERSLQAADGVAADQDLGADLFRQRLDPRGEVHGVAHERVREPVRAADGPARTSPVWRA